MNDATALLKILYQSEKISILMYFIVMWKVCTWNLNLYENVVFLINKYKLIIFKYLFHYD